MEHDHVGEEVFFEKLRGEVVPAQDVGRQDSVGHAAHGEEFRYALDQGEEDVLRPGQALGHAGPPKKAGVFAPAFRKG